jgi:tRNA threonylcarbamoyladenosine biosynthesis protein TsaE
METPVQRAFACRSPEELDAIAAEILSLLPGPGTVGFYGPLGAGKTALIKALCRRLGVVHTTASPSFALLHEYALPDGEPVYHFDFFRIRSETEAYDLGYESYFFSGRYCFIEWAEKVRRLLPPGCAEIRIEAGPQKRTITLTL